MRRQSDLTQAELARKAGCSTDTIRKLESDERRPSRDLAFLLAGVFDLGQRERSEFVKLARGTATVSATLPAPVTRLIGRQADVGSIRQQLLRPDLRLLTLVGAPGMGKTRLALEVAHDLNGQFRDGVVLVLLAPVHDSALVGDAIAQALGVRAHGRRSVVDAICDWLRDRRVLLVLDNFEHVLAAREDISRLLVTASGLVIMITSREALSIYGEHLYRVSPLELPFLLSRERRPVGATAKPRTVPRSASETLFLERARAVRPNFASAASDREILAQICVRLDGIPLAIELAASRARSMSPGAILEGLRQQLNVLSAGPADFTPRQRSMRGALDWSYELLGNDERGIFNHLAIFAGGATIESAHAVCAEGEEVDATRNALESLAGKSLVSVSDMDGATRFVMLEVIREYALERLRLEEGHETEVRFRGSHARYFAEFAQRCDAGLRGSDQVTWLRRLDADHDNFRAALGHSIEVADGPTAGELCAHLWPFWRRRAHYVEGRRWITSGLALGVAIPDMCRASMLNGLGVLSILQGDYTLADAVLNEALQLALALEHQEQIALSTSNLGWLAHDREDPARAEQLFGESLRLREELGDVVGQATSLDNLGVVALERNDLHAACELFERSARLYRPTGDSIGLAQVLSNLGWARQELGEYAIATQLFSESLAVAGRLEWPRGVASATGNLALMALYAADTARATDLFLDSVSMLDELGDRRGVAQALEGLAGVAAVRSHAEEAARLLGVAHALREQIGAPLLPANRAWLERFEALAREQVSEAVWQQAWTEGRVRPIEAVLSRLLNWSGQSHHSQLGPHAATV